MTDLHSPVFSVNMSLSNGAALDGRVVEAKNWESRTIVVKRETASLWSVFIVNFSVPSSSHGHCWKELTA